VIGAGSVGIEIVGELIHKYEKKNISIIASRDTFLERMPPKAHLKILNHFSKFSNIKFYLGEKVNKIEGNTIYTTKGTEIKADVTFSCIGFMPNTKIMRDNMGEFLNESGFVNVNQNLQLKGHPNIFVAGVLKNIKIRIS
jgi:apoptosis-inducing factor 2